MRVIFLTHSYPRWPGDSSGAALGSLARALLRRGISVRVVVPGDGSGGRAEVDGVAVRRVSVSGSLAAALADQDAFAARLRRPLGWSTLVRLSRALRSAVRREVAAGVDVIHAHWIPSALATPTGLPAVLTLHGSDGVLLQTSRTARALSRPIFSRASIVTAVSRHTGEAVQNVLGRFIAANHVHPMPVDTRGRTWTRGGGGALFLGRLDRNGRVHLAIETVAQLASAGRMLPLTIVGRGPERRALELHAERLGVSALVRFLEPMAADQGRSHLERADILLFTARADGNADAALDALIAGVPVVACWDSGVGVEIVPESGAGRLSLPAPESLAANARSILADPDRLAVARLVGEAWRARLAPERVAQLCEGWYRDALAQ